MKTTETFRTWLNRRHLTLEDFARAVPGMRYSTVSKWASRKAHPTKINDAHRFLIKQKYPDCPLAR